MGRGGQSFITSNLHWRGRRRRAARGGARTGFRRTAGRRRAAMRCGDAEAMTGAKIDDEAEHRRTDGPTPEGGYAHGTAAEGKKAAPTIWSQPPCQRICLGESTLSPCRDLVAQEHSPRGAPRCRRGSPAKRPTPRAGPPEPLHRNRSPRGPRHQGPPLRRHPAGQPTPGPRPQRHPRPRRHPRSSS